MGGGGSKPAHTATNDTLNVMGGAIFYFHANYKMDHNQPGKRYGKGNYANVHTDTFSSAKIAPGCKVEMYEHDHFNGRKVTKPVNISDKATNIPDLHAIGMGDNITSLKVICSESDFCKANPVTDKIDCTKHCPPGSSCNVKLARYCSNHLDDHRCKTFCMDYKNNCDDDKVENYCKSKQDASGMIPHECQCIMYPPVNDLERRIDAGNGGVYDDKKQIKKGNYACWSPKCKNGTAPEKGQLHLSKWWNYISGCTPITICNVDLGDANLNMYDKSLFVVNNNCGGGAASADLVNSGTDDPPPVVEDAKDAQDALDDDELLSGLNEKQRKVAMVAGVFILIFMLMSIRKNKKMKRVLSSQGIVF
jgi:hypothetical protein